MAGFEIFGKVGMDISKVRAGMKRAGESVKGFSKKVKETLGPVGRAMAGAFAVHAITNQITETFKWAAQVKSLGDRFGLTTNEVQGLEHAFTKTGMSAEDGFKAYKTMQIYQHRAVSEFRGEMRRGELQNAFKMLGASVDDIKNKNPQQLFMQIAAKMKTADASSQGLHEAINTIFGGSGLAVLESFKGGLAEITQQFNSMGLVIEESTINKLSEANDKMEDFSLKWTKIKAFAVGALVEIDSAAGKVGGAIGELLAESFDAGQKRDVIGASQWLNPLKWYDKLYEHEMELQLRKKREAKEAAKEKEAAALRQTELVEEQIATEEKAKEKAKRIEAEKAAAVKQTAIQKAWNIGPSGLEKIGGRIGAGTAGVNIPKRQLELMVRAQQQREDAFKLQQQLWTKLTGG
tara:strand:+ start:139 stop:1356 length:1218 start_codon:yes stop_codon:yes gene_type:complete